MEFTPKLVLPVLTLDSLPGALAWDSNHLNIGSNEFFFFSVRGVERKAYMLPPLLLVFITNSIYFLIGTFWK